MSFTSAKYYRQGLTPLSTVIFSLALLLISCGPSFVEGQNCSPKNPCLNGGTCVSSSASTYTCTCHSGYSGQNCQTGPCSSNPCLNGGTCRDPGYTGNYMCSCQEHTTGQMCETVLPLCDSDPCQNGGTCIETGPPGRPTGYRCTCPDGWKGKDCTIRIPKCQTLPCQNGGTCTDLTNGGFSCNCASGWSGIVCTTNVDECQSGPCQNNAVCTDRVDYYECTCPAGYSGTNCQTQDFTPACNKNPCKNGGTCTNGGVGGYTCTCNPGWAGKTCTKSASVFQYSQQFALFDFDWAKDGNLNSDKAAEVCKAIRANYASQNLTLASCNVTAFDKPHVRVLLQVVSPTGQNITADDIQALTDIATMNSAQNGVSFINTTSSVVDINECANAQLNDCHQNAVCINLPGTYTCSCKTGYLDTSQYTAYPGRTCVDDANSLSLWEIVSVALAAAAVSVICCCCCYQCIFLIRWRKKHRKIRRILDDDVVQEVESDTESTDSPEVVITVLYDPPRRLWQHGNFEDLTSHSSSGGSTYYD